MSLLANPPDLFLASMRHIIRRERSIQGWVPLGCNLRHTGKQIIKPFEHFAARTIGTATGGMGSSTHGCLPRMTLFTSPPDTTVAVSRHHFRCQRGILFHVPLCSDFGKLTCQVIFSRHHFFPGTDRTACTAMCT